MKRLVLNQYGGPEVIEEETVDDPRIKTNQVLVQQKASSINPVDIKIRKGKIKFVTGFNFPKKLGTDFSGIVIGSKSNDYKEGDAVYGFISPLKGGAYADYLVVDAKTCAPKPQSLTYEEAGVLPIVGLTVFEGLIYHGRLKAGDEVFINGCTGGVGAFAVQVAKAKGAQVTGTCSGKNMAFAGEIGADEVLDYHDLDFASLNNKFDIILDTTGKLAPWQLKSIGKNTAMIATAGISLPLLLHGIFSRSTKMIVVRPGGKKLKDLGDFVNAHNIKPIISKSWRLNEMHAAQDDFEKNGVRGKVLIKINS